MADFKLETATSHLKCKGYAEILQSLNYKVFSTLFLKIVAIESSVLILGKSAIFSQCIVAMLWRHQIVVYTWFIITLLTRWESSRYKYFQINYWEVVFHSVIFTLIGFTKSKCQIKIHTVNWRIDKKRSKLNSQSHQWEHREYSPGLFLFSSALTLEHDHTQQTLY